MRLILLIISILGCFTRSSAQSQLQKFIDCGKAANWQVKVSGSLCEYEQVDRDRFFEGLCAYCSTFAKDKYDLPAGASRTDESAGGGSIKYDYNVFFSVRGSDWFDPITDQVVGGPDSKTIFVLFSTRQAYEKELAAIKALCTFNELDGSFREKSGKFVAVPITWANNAPKPRLLRGFRVETL